MTSVFSETNIGKETVIRALPAGLDKLFDILHSASPSGWSRAQLLEELEHPDAEVWCFDKDGPRAFLAARRIVDEWWIMEVATHPDYRRRGAARALLKKAMFRAAENDLPLWLEVRASNAAAIALYKGGGFIELARRRGYYAPIGGIIEREDAVVMRWISTV